MKVRKLQKLPWVNRRPFFVFTGDEMALAVEHKHEVVVLFVGTPGYMEDCLKAVRYQLRRVSRIKMPKKLQEEMVSEVEEILGGKR